METLLMKESPLLLPLNKQKTVYDGFITVQDRDFRVRISLPPDLQLKRAKLHCCWQLKRLLKAYQPILKQRLQRSSDLGSFILELKTVLEVALKNRPDHVTIPPPQYYSQLIAELESLGWDKYGHVSRTIYSSACTCTVAFLIVCFDKNMLAALLPSTQSTLAHIHKRFLAELEGLAEFWSVLDEIDVQTWVLEPEKPSRADTMRRIAIGNNVSIKVEIDPRHPRMLPDCCLLGAEHVVTPLRKQEINCGLMVFLCLLLNIVCMPGAEYHQSLSTECGICYSFRLESAIPDQVCNDPRCGQPFHQACLYEWLRGLPTSRQSFNTVFGECPYCSKPITVKTAVHKQ
uniref:RING-type domain-containing protein n=1 Tax=Denticeps clupeoides TaxID=299321 RepID=A0AAY4E7L6_9TELE